VTYEGVVLLKNFCSYLPPIKKTIVHVLASAISLFLSVQYFTVHCSNYYTQLHSSSPLPVTKILLTAQECLAFLHFPFMEVSFLCSASGKDCCVRSEKCVVRRFRRSANVYLHKPRYYSTAYYTPRLVYGIAYCS